MVPPPLRLLRSPSSLTRHILRPLLRHHQRQLQHTHSQRHILRLHLQTRIPQRLGFSTSSKSSRNRSSQCAAGTTTPVPEPSSRTDSSHQAKKKPPFYFEAGYALYAKRPSRPFPPPFLSYPSGSFSDPLSTHHKSRDRRQLQPTVDGEMILGVTNGDDAVVVGENYVGANDGVGAWATKEKGHAA
jgi:hypothetical protein